MTFDVLNWLTSKVAKLEQLKNIRFISVTFDVSKLAPNVKVPKLEELWNILLIVVTFDVLSILKFKLSKPVSENIPLISVTFDVSKLDPKVKVVNFVQNSNILAIVVTFDVLKFTSKVDKFEH